MEEPEELEESEGDPFRIFLDEVGESEGNPPSLLSLLGRANGGIPF